MNPGVHERTAAANVSLPAIGQRLSTGSATSYQFSGCDPEADLLLAQMADTTFDAASQAWYMRNNAQGLGVRIRLNGILLTESRQTFLDPPAAGSWSMTYEVIRRSADSLVQGAAAPALTVTICPLKRDAAGSGCETVGRVATFINRIHYPAQPATCTVSDIAPALLPAGPLPTVGSVSMANPGFLVPMTCLDGNMASVPLRFTLRDVEALGSTSADLTPVPAGTTSGGVRLQLLRRSAGGGYVVQNMGTSWTQTWTPGGAFPAPDLAVHYLRIGPVTPGRIRSQVSLTIDYP